MSLKGKVVSPAPRLRERKNNSYAAISTFSFCFFMNGAKVFMGRDRKMGQTRSVL